MDLITVLGNIVIFSAISVFLFELFQKFILKPFGILLSSSVTQVLTWIFSFFVVYIDGAFAFGIFGGVTIFYTLLIGLLVGLAANGIWSFPPVQIILEKLKIK